MKYYKYYTIVFLSLLPNLIFNVYFLVIPKEKSE